MGNKPERLLSLDVFRGITIAGMILVNNPGSWSTMYPAVSHATWNGCTPTDLIFPFFLFIVGVAITFSLSKRKERGDDHQQLLKQVFRRSLTLFGLGLFLHSFPIITWTDGIGIIDFSQLRILGVLQRIAIVYFISSFLFLKVSSRSLVYIGSGILVFYYLIMTFIPVPGIGMPDLLTKPVGIINNLAGWLDKIILGSHAWRGSAPWDPEGVLSTLPAIGSTIIGMLTGQWLRKDIESAVKVVWLFVTGNLLLLCGYVFDMWFPINKSLWTSTYVLFTGGWALVFLAMCYWLIDVKGYKAWAKPFHVYGMNAITVFFLSGILARLMYLIKIPVEGESISVKAFLYENLFLSWLEPLNASLLYSIIFVLFWLGWMWILYSKKIFIKV